MINFPKYQNFKSVTWRKWINRLFILYNFTLYLILKIVVIYIVYHQLVRQESYFFDNLVYYRKAKKILFGNILYIWMFCTLRHKMKFKKTKIGTLTHHANTSMQKKFSTYFLYIEVHWDVCHELWYNENIFLCWKVEKHSINYLENIG